MFFWLRPVFAILARFGPWVVLAAILFLTGLVLTLLGALFGFSLDDVDRWLEAHGGLLNAVGSLLFRVVCGIAFLICVATFLGALFARLRPGSGDPVAPEAGERAGPPGWGCALLAIPVGYFAWIGMVARY
jgi:hypothetical protein